MATNLLDDPKVQAAIAKAVAAEKKLTTAAEKKAEKDVKAAYAAVTKAVKDVMTNALTDVKGDKVATTAIKEIQAALFTAIKLAQITEE